MNSSHAWKGIFIFTFFLLLTAPVEASGPLPSDIVSAINQERTANGLRRVQIDPALTEAAQARSAVLASAGQIYHVTAPQGTPWPEISNVGYEYSFAGENLALGIETANELAERWMASPTHRKNILEEEFEDIGVGVTQGLFEGRVVSYVVSYYGKKKTGTSVTQVSQTIPVNSSIPTVSLPKPPQASRAQVAGSQSAPVMRASAPKSVSAKSVKKVSVDSPVLSSKYTLETLPPALPPNLVAPNSDESETQVVERIIAFLGHRLRILMTRVGWL